LWPHFLQDARAKVVDLEVLLLDVCFLFLVEMEICFFLFLVEICFSSRVA
jgi:hypothetical protein